MPEQPLVSIVTPSYNMAAFLPEAIESVLAQDYPRIEYIVMDGGSNDGTLEILEGYRNRLEYVSSPDGGAAAAINDGFRKCHGSIFAWLNADDTYLPGAVSAAVQQFAAAPGAAVVYGEGYMVNRQGEIIRPYPTQPFSRDRFSRECYICQPAAFLRKSAFDEAGMLDSGLHAAFDYDLWIRLSERNHFARLEEYLATSRMHPNTKTLGDRSRVYSECFAVLKRHFGFVPFPWIYANCCYMLDKRDQFFEPLRPSIGKYLLSLPFGCFHNRSHMIRFMHEWWGVMSWTGFIRRVRKTG
jgi:glycosyltransferase involved in cell wall biosynthesis